MTSIPIRECTETVVRRYGDRLGYVHYPRGRERRHLSWWSPHVDPMAAARDTDRDPWVFDDRSKAGVFCLRSVIVGAARRNVESYTPFYQDFRFEFL